jgi:hypothetical protein
MYKLLLQTGSALLKQDNGFLLLNGAVALIEEAFFILKRRRR